MGTPESDLSEEELADAYLLHAGAINDYRSEITLTSGLSTGEPTTERISFDRKSPSSARMEYLESSRHTPGTFILSDGTTSWYYDAEKGSWDISYNSNYLSEYDYQDMVRRIVEDRSFTIIGKAQVEDIKLYRIEVVTEPYSDKYTRYISSKVQAWIDPASGLAWNISTYYPKDTVNNVIRYDRIEVNTGIPDSRFDFVPPEGSHPRCDPRYAGYVAPVPVDTSVPISEPMPDVDFYLNESDSGRTIVLQKGDIIQIDLRVITSLGYRWLMPVTGPGLELMNAGTITEVPEVIPTYPGAFKSFPSYNRMRYRAVEEGTTVFDGVFSTDGCDIENSRRFNLTVNVV